MLFEDSYLIIKSLVKSPLVDVRHFELFVLAGQVELGTHLRWGSLLSLVLAHLCRLVELPLIMFLGCGVPAHWLYWFNEHLRLFLLLNLLLQVPLIISQLPLKPIIWIDDTPALSHIIEGILEWHASGFHYVGQDCRCWSRNTCSTMNQHTSSFKSLCNLIVCIWKQSTNVGWFNIQNVVNLNSEFHILYELFHLQGMTHLIQQPLLIQFLLNEHPRDFDRKQLCNHPTIICYHFLQEFGSLINTSDQTSWTFFYYIKK